MTNPSSPKETRKKYQRDYQRRKRKEQKIVTVTIPKEHKEMIMTAAKDYNLSVSQFLVQSTISSLNKTYLIPDPERVTHLQQMLSLWHSEMQRLIRLAADDEIIYVVKILQQRVATLESQVKAIFRNPIPKPAYDHQG